MVVRGQYKENNGAAQFMQRLDPHTIQLEQLEKICLEDDCTDAELLLGYYRLQCMQKAYPAMEILEDMMRARKAQNPDDEILDLLVQYSRLLDVIQEFDLALSEFTQHDDGYASDDEPSDSLEAEEDDTDEYMEDILFDKIKNLRSSFRYYCEEVRRICINANITQS